MCAPRRLGRGLALAGVPELSGSAITEIRQLVFADTLVGRQDFARSQQIMLFDV
jgi:hypothetical protein